jgi:hypothetical protein
MDLNNAGPLEGLAVLVVLVGLVVLVAFVIAKTVDERRNRE